MSAKNKSKIRNFYSILVIFSCLTFGCDVGSIEQSSANGNANAAFDKSPRLNLVASSSPPNAANANSTFSDADRSTNGNTNSEANIEISNNIEISETAEPAATQNDSSRKSSTNSQFDSAAAQNQDLARNLVWTFGGKNQTGWYIYKPLICQTVGVETGAGENDFAENLVRWQKANGTAPNGILDGVTMALLVNKWQANRLKIHGFASPDELAVEPTADFYDVSRPDELRQVERETYAAYKKLVAAAAADKSLNLKSDGRGELAPSERFLKIVSAFRSRDYQDKLRRESPNSGRAGLAVGNSPHFTGRALDLYVGGEPVATRDENRAVQVNTVVYRWLVKNAGRFGFKPYFYEPWHWEYAPE